MYAVQSGTVKYWGQAQGYGGPDPAGWLVIDSNDAEGSGCFEYGHIVREVAPYQHVSAGQRIGHVNPDRRTNAGVDPHLHLSFMPYEYNRDKKQDPMPRLSGAALPGDIAVAGLAGQSLSFAQSTSMTIFGPDISNHQGRVDISQIVREGFQFLWAKVSEGDYFRDAFWADTRDACRDLGLIVAGYHYVSTDAPERQADLFVSHLGDNSIPAMLDFERGSGDIDNFWAVLNAIEDRGVRVRLSYIPRWYWDQVGRPDISCVPGLIQSSYVNASGYASVIYPGDGSDRWAGFGGREVDVLQFTDKAVIAGQLMDANAFRGTPDELRRLLGLEPLSPATTVSIENTLRLARDPALGTGYHFAAADLGAPHPFRRLSGECPSALSWTAGESAQILLIEHLAVTYGDPDAIELLRDVASAADDDKKADFPDRQRDARIAALILNKVPKQKSSTSTRRKPTN